MTTISHGWSDSLLLQQDESSRRYDMQLEQKKEKVPFCGWPFVSKFEMYNTYLRCVKFVRDWYIFIELLHFSFKIGVFI